MELFDIFAEAAFVAHRAFFQFGQAGVDGVHVARLADLDDADHVHHAVWRADVDAVEFDAVFFVQPAFECFRTVGDMFAFDVVAFAGRQEGNGAAPAASAIRATGAGG